MTARNTTKKPAEQPAAIDEKQNINPADEKAAADRQSIDLSDGDATASQQDTAADDEAAVETYCVEVVARAKGVQRINLRDDASADDDSNIDHTVSVGTRLKAVADLGEWTKLTHGLYIMSKYVKKL